MLASRIISKCKIIYENGITQYKDLISQIDYEEIIKPKLNEAYLLEKENKWKETARSKQLKLEVTELFGTEYFTTHSPLGLAIRTNCLTLPLTQGGTTKCLVIPI